MAGQVARYAQIVPTDLDIGTLGPDRSGQAWRMVEDWYLRNPLPMEDRVAYLSAAWERPDGRSTSIHATGITLLGQGDTLVDLQRVWQEMAADRARRRVLRATMDLGQGRTVPPKVLREVHDTLGAWTGAWQDLLALAGWYDLLHRANLTSAFASSDSRLDDWLAQIVAAGRHLPVDYQ